MPPRRFDTCRIDFETRFLEQLSHRRLREGLAGFHSAARQLPQLSSLGIAEVAHMEQ
jgi:hypothetical protein